MWIWISWSEKRKQTFATILGPALCLLTLAVILLWANGLMTHDVNTRQSSSSDHCEGMQLDVWAAAERRDYLTQSDRESK